MTIFRYNVHFSADGVEDWRFDSKAFDEITKNRMARLNFPPTNL